MGYIPPPPPPTGSIYLYALTPGDHGQVTATFYTAPYCGGSFLRRALIFSTGSNVANFTAESDGYLPYGESALMNAMARLQQAADAGARASITGLTFEVTSFLTLTYSQLQIFAIRPN